MRSSVCVGDGQLADIDGIAAHLDGQATSPIMSPAEGPTMVPPMTRWFRRRRSAW